MALGYRKISAEEDKMRNLLPKGEYPFHIKDIEVKPSKNGINKMLVVTLNVLNNEGRQFIVTDWVMLDMENMEWKLRHFADTCGLLDRYDQGILEERDFIGKHGVAKIIITDYEKDGEMLKSNKVADYIQPGKTKGNLKAANDFIDDDIPL